MYEQVGCRKCGKGNAWKIFYDGKTFTAQCECHHTITITQPSLVKKPDKTAIKPKNRLNGIRRKQMAKLNQKSRAGKLNA